MIPDWTTNCVYLAAMLENEHPTVFKALRQALSAHGTEVRLLTNVKDFWPRDYCPIQIADWTFVKFRYDPDYLRGCENRKTGPGVVKAFRDLGTCCRSDINLDGGNVVASRDKVIVTDKIYRENPECRRPQLRERLKTLLQVDELIVIPKEPYDIFGHADGQVRFVDEETVLVNDYSQIDLPYGERLVKVLRGHRLRVETLPYFQEKQTRHGVPSAVGCFINYLRTEKAVIAPVYGTALDKRALRKLEECIPGIPIIPLNCTDLARDGGVLNCVSAAYRIFPKSSVTLTDSCQSPSPE